jgi:hypothetical protein
MSPGLFGAAATVPGGAGLMPTPIPGGAVSG